MQQQISSWQIEPETSHLGLLQARERWEKLWGLVGAKAVPKRGLKRPLPKFPCGNPWVLRAQSTWDRAKPSKNILVPVSFCFPHFLAAVLHHKLFFVVVVVFFCFFFFFVKYFVLHRLSSCRGFLRRIPLPLFVSPELSAPGIFPARQHNEIIISRIWLNVTNQDWSFSDRYIYCFCYLPGHFISIFIFLQSLKPRVQAGLWAGFSLCVHLCSAEQQQHRLRFVHSGSGVRLLHSPK